MPFLGLNNNATTYVPWERSFAFRSIFGDDPKGEISSAWRTEICYSSSVIQPLYYASAREMKHLFVLAVLGVFFTIYWLVVSSTRTHLVSRFWLPTTTVWRTRRPHTPHQEPLWISCAAVSCEKLCSCRKWSVSVQLFFFVSFWSILTTAAPLSRGVGLCWESAEINFERKTSCCDKNLLGHGRTNRGSKRNVSK